MKILAHTISKNGKNEMILSESRNGILRLDRLRVGAKGARLVAGPDGTISSRTTWKDFLRLTASQIPSSLTPEQSDRRLWRAYQD